MITSGAVRPVTFGGNGNDSVAGPAYPLARVSVTFTSRFAPRFNAPPPAGAAASVPGASFTLITTVVAGANALMFAGFDTVAVSVAFLSAAAFAAVAAAATAAVS